MKTHLEPILFSLAVASGLVPAHEGLNYIYLNGIVAKGEFYARLVEI
jgi:hypothetical protein